MFCVNVILTAKDENNINEIRGLLSQAAALSRAEPGCLRFEVYHSQSDANTFLLCERWESEQAWQDHRKERAYTEIYQPQVLPLVDRVPHISELVE